jgi:hypothetical protein
MKHKHYECIVAWAEGAEIEYYHDFMWQTAKNPAWSLSGQYRVKPEPKPKEYYDEDTFDVQYLYFYNDSKSKIIRCRPTLLIEPLDWVYMGKVRLEK